MSRKNFLSWFLFFLLLIGFLHPVRSVQAVPPQAPAQVSAFDLILAMNTLRVSFGLPALIEDPIVNAVAQNTAEIMAANQMSWHIGDVRGRIAAAGYGGGATVFATENFAVGTNMGIDQIMVVWADAEHMRPATTPAYCHVGAGVATAANGAIYYVLQAAYISGQACGEYTPSGGGTGSSGGAPLVPQIIVPVKIATPDTDGNTYHIVEPGQSFWAIAIAYQVTIADIEFWNNVSRESKLQVGQRLFIPGKNTKGYATPTPVGMVVVSPPDEDGRVVHTVQSYQTLSTIAAAYQVSVDNILSLNGLQVDWPLQIGQELLVDPGTILSPIQQLTPDSNGNYYHTVQSGQTLFGIAGLYGVSLDSLLAWNGLASDAIIRPEQKLLLMLTPPATPTPTPGPATSTPAPTETLQATATLPQASATVPVRATPTSAASTPAQPASFGAGLPVTAVFIAGGIGLLLWVVTRKRPEQD